MRRTLLIFSVVVFVSVSVFVPNPAPIANAKGFLSETLDSSKVFIVERVNLSSIRQFLSNGVQKVKHFSILTYKQAKHLSILTFKHFNNLPRGFKEALRGVHKFVSAPFRKEVVKDLAKDLEPAEKEPVEEDLVEPATAETSKDYDTLKKEIAQLKTELEEKEIIRKEIVQKITQETTKVVEVPKEITKVTELVTEKVTEVVRTVDITDLQGQISDVNLKLSQITDASGFITSPRQYQEQGDLTFSTIGTGSILLSAAQSILLQADKIILDANAPVNQGVSSIEIRDDVNINSSLTLGGTNFVADNLGNLTLASDLTVNDVTASGNLDVTGNLSITATTTLTRATIQNYLDFTPISQPSTQEGRLYYDTSLDKMFFYNSSDWRDMSIWEQASGYIYPTTVGTTLQITDTSGNMILPADLTVDTNTLYIDSANNRVGIGTTSPPEKLTVSGGNVLADNLYARQTFWADKILESSNLQFNKDHNAIGGRSKGDAWTEAGTDALLVATVNHSSLVYDGKMWIIGGYTSGGATSKVYYSSDGITWAEAGTDILPVAVNTHTSLVYNGKMWVIGGEDSGGNIIQKVYYSTDGTTWTEAGTDALPLDGIGYHTSLVYDGKMWVIGGFDASWNTLRKVYYSTDGITWTEAGTDALLVGNYGHTSLVYDGKMWVIGGGTGGFTRKVYYSTDGITWSEAGADALQIATAYHTSLVYDGKMWLIGGNTAGGKTKKVYYSLDGVTWTEAGTDALQTATYIHTSLIYDGKMWVIGGSDDSSYLRKVYYSLPAIKGGLVVQDQSNSELFRIMSSGNIGIGDTSPDFIFETVATSTDGYFGVSSSADQDGDIFIINSSGNVGIGTTTPATLFTVATSTDIFNVTSAGNVGIGVTSPSQKLDVNGIINLAYGNAIRWGNNADLQMGYGIDGQPGDVMVFRGHTASNQPQFVWQDQSSLVRMAINMNTGNVGIATTTPSARLVVLSHSSGRRVELTETTTSPVIKMIGDRTTIGGYGVWTADNLAQTAGWFAGIDNNAKYSIGYGSTWPTAKDTPDLLIDTSGNVIIGTLSSAGNRYVLADSTGKLYEHTSGPDFAEYFPVREGIEEGDVVVMTEDTDPETAENFILGTSIKPYDNKLVGVISPEGTPAIGPIPEGENYLPVALAGRVPAKVSLENGSIEIGDLITSSSIPGVGMKATKPGMIIGTALEPFDDSNASSTIIVFVNTGWYGGELTEEGQLAGGGSLAVQSLLDNFINLTKNALETLGLYIEDGIARVKELITNRITTKEIQMIDKATGEAYCTWLENGEWVKIKGECEK